MRCCGKSCDTPFCPNCGQKPKPDTALDELLAYCRARQEANAKTAARHLEAAAENAEHAGFAAKAAATATNWRRWADALEEVVADHAGRWETTGDDAPEDCP